MEAHLLKNRNLSRQKGVSVVLVAIFLILFISIAALAIDIGRLMVTRNELQNIADAAALAAGRKLGEIYEGLSENSETSYVCNAADQDLIRKRAIEEVGLKSSAGGLEGIVIQEDDVRIWYWNGKDEIVNLSPADNYYTYPNAVTVMVRRDDQENNPVTTFFASIFGIGALPSKNDATAALTSQASSEPGEIGLPIGISCWFFQNEEGEDERCNDFVKLHPTNDPISCAGWTTFSDGANASNLKSILEGMTDGSYVPDGTTAYADGVNLTGGDVAAAWDPLLVLFKEKGYDVKRNPDYVEDDPLTNEVEGDPLIPKWIPVATTTVDGIEVPVTGHLDPDDYPDVVPINTDGEPLDEQPEEGGNLEPALYPDGNNYKPTTPRNMHHYETSVIVYGRWTDEKNETGAICDDEVGCGNPSGNLPVLGYAKVVMTDVVRPPSDDAQIKMQIKCRLYSGGPTHGGGAFYGIRGTIPNLVE